MSGNQTTITNPESRDTKSFVFDQSYWSHDGFQEDEDGVCVSEPPRSPYADQTMVFRDLGQGVLDNAWQGYNAALFAYGQTGSGKSYSMIGYGANKGVVPILCGELFKAIQQNDDAKKQFQVTFSMLEIYNEQVRDLLSTTKQRQIGGLKIRQNPKTGFYVEGLKKMPVQDYKTIEKLMEQGTVNRTTASTNMNATSSRSHMVITIKFNQVFVNDLGQSTTKSSEISLVDLAGSERADSTGATGDRLKEGSAINQSLSTLGNVISALADLSMGKKKTIVPYRDSVLTKLLQSVLGGNSRTIMIAALSPADINYDETLSTLRYADRAKKIQNRAVVNESPTDRLIRELKEENARLMNMMKKHGGGAGSDDTDDLRRMLEENEQHMKEMNLSWEQRLEQARSEWTKSLSHGSGRDGEWQHEPYFANVNEDPQLTGVIKHLLEKDKTVIGRSKEDGVDIELKGLGIQCQHAIVLRKDSSLCIDPLSDQCQVIVNGVRTQGTIALHHLDRIKLGTSSLFLYIGHPSERKHDSDQIDKYNYDYFMTELAEREGLGSELATPHGTQDGHGSQMTLVLQKLIGLLPRVNEANAIGEELKKSVTFHLEIKSFSCHDPTGNDQKKEVYIRVSNTKSKQVWIWSSAKFMNRKLLIDELHMRWMDRENLAMDKDKDPFWDPPEDIFLGSCHIWLQNLAYLVDMDEHLSLHNYQGREEGVVHAKVEPCDIKGRPLNEQADIVDPRDLLGRSMHFCLTLDSCMGIRWVKEWNVRGFYFSIFGGNEKSETTWGQTDSDELGLRKQITVPKVTAKFLSKLRDEAIVLELWGAQRTEDDNTRGNVHTGESHHVSAELLALKEECEALKHENFKLKALRERCVAGGVKAPLTRTNSVEGMVMDVNLAKSLKEFFRDMKIVQDRLAELRTRAYSMHEETTKSQQNGHVLAAAISEHVDKLKDTEQHLNDAVSGLREGVTMTIRKSSSAKKES